MSIDMENSCNQAQFLNKEIIMNILRLKSLREIFYNSQFKIYLSILRIVTIGKPYSTFFLIL